MANDRVRTTISLRPEVHEIFIKMAEASGVSVSRCMGDWLQSTAEGAQFVSAKMEEIRRAPGAVMHDFHAFAKGAGGEIELLYGQFAERRQGGSPAAAERAGRAAMAHIAPSSNTGLKSPVKTVSRRK